MKILIVYFSYTKNNEVLAYALKDRLGCDLIQIEDVKKRNAFTTLIDVMFPRNTPIRYPKVSLLEYDHIVLLSPIWNSKIPNPMRSFLLHQKEKITSYSFISVCGGRDKQRTKLNDTLIQLVGKYPLSIQELSIKSLLRFAGKAETQVGQYKLTKGDLIHFNSEIDNFIGSLHKAAAMSTQERHVKP